MSGETLSLWMRAPDAHHCWLRTVKGGDPKVVADRRVFVEKTPRVYDPTSGIPPGHSNSADRPSWISGYKGHADEGDGPDLDSRRWADEKARELGYVLPDMEYEIEQLIASWSDEPIWDLEDTEGFEEHRERLRAVRLEREAAAERQAAKEHELDIQKLMAPALALLPEHADDGLSRTVAETAGSTSNIILRMVAEMLLPIVRRLDGIDTRLGDLDEETDQTLADHKAELDELREQIGAA